MKRVRRMDRILKINARKQIELVERMNSEDVGKTMPRNVLFLNKLAT